MSGIHPMAIIEDGAEVHESVTVGPFSIIESGAVVGEGCIIESNARIYSPTRMGKNNKVSHGAVLGCEPQDLSYTPEKSKPLVIGDDNTFREHVNISRGVKTDDGTVIGNGNYFMSEFHAGHDSIFGDNNIVAGSTILSGHVEVGNHTFISGLTGVHQFCRIGDYAMVGGCSRLPKDVPPYAMVEGNPARVIGLNSVGLRRAGFNAEARKVIKRTYQTIYHSGLNISQALEQLKQQPQEAETTLIIEFFEQSERGVTAHR